MTDESRTQVITRLRRDTTNSVWAGVAAGVARRLDVAPWLVRLAFVIASVFGGIGLLLYVAGWVLIPADGEDDALLERWIRDGDRTNWAGVVLIGIAAVTLLGSVRFLDGEVVFAVALLVVGVLLYRGTFDDQRSGDAPPTSDGGNGPTAQSPATGLISHSETAPTTTADDANTADTGESPDWPPGRDPSAGEDGAPDELEADPAPSEGAEALAGDDEDTSVAAPDAQDDQEILIAAGMVPPAQPPIDPPPVPPTPPAPPRPSAPKSILGRVTIAAMMIVLGALAVLDNWITGLTVTEYLAAAVLVIGIGLLIGAWWGRARVTIVLGLFLVTVMQMTAWFDVPLSGGIGDPVYTIESVADLDKDFRLLAGELTLDLRQLRVEGEHRVDASVAAGHLVVRVPDETNLEIRAAAVGGDLNVLGFRESGADTSLLRVISVEGATGTLVLDLEVGFGQIDVPGTGG